MTYSVVQIGEVRVEGKTETKEKSRIVELVAVVCLIVTYILLNCVINNNRYNSVNLVADDEKNAYQIDKIELDDDKLRISGWFFLLEKSGNVLTELSNDSEVDVVLMELGIEQKNNGDDIAKIIRGECRRTVRNDVNDYFFCEFDYSNSGFEAEFKLSKLDIRNKNYQILIQPEAGTKREVKKAIQLNAYIVNGRLSYVDPRNDMSVDVEGTDLEQIVNKGYCLVSNPEFHISVYQYGWKLYWIAGPGYAFVDNGTYMQFQMTTTQFDKLPSYRTDNGSYWGNIGGTFETYEITDEMDCGKYRVSVRDIPNGYSINSIILGYYTEEAWEWREIIRPHYGFEKIPSVDEYGYVG